MISHPAKYSPQLWEPMQEMIRNCTWRTDSQVGRWAYDPMAGVGTLAEIVAPLGFSYVGAELEPEWAMQSAHTFVGDCREMLGRCDLIVCSPPYGNRFADQYMGTPAEIAERAASGKKPRRMSYAISLGRKLDPTKSAAALQWGPKYRDLMFDIWTHVVDNNLAPGGYFLLNVASHMRGQKYQPVAEWNIGMLIELGLEEIERRFIETPGMRDGQNRDSRVGGEWLVMFWKPSNG